MVLYKQVDGEFPTVLKVLLSKFDIKVPASMESPQIIAGTENILELLFQDFRIPIGFWREESEGDDYHQIFLFEEVAGRVLLSLIDSPRALSGHWRYCDWIHWEQRGKSPDKDRR